MGSGCFSAKSVRIHPVVPTEPSDPAPPNLHSGVAAAGSAAVKAATASTSASASAASTADHASEEVKNTSTPLQIPAPKARPKPKPSLIRAVKENNIPLIDELLQTGCGLEDLGMWDNTPLLAACAHGYSDAALKLIARKANVSAINEHGAMPLHYACVEGMSEVVQALINAVSSSSDGELPEKFVNCGGSQIYNRHLDAYASRTPLGSAAESGFPAIITTLVAAKAQLESATDDGCTALWLACRHSRVPAVKLLLQMSASTDAKNAQGVSVLEAATTACNEDVVLAVLGHGVTDVNDTVGSPLRDSVRQGRRAAVEALLTHGAAVQPTKASGAPQTLPLHAACEKADEHLVALLVRARADPSLGDANGRTAFDLLRRRGLADGQIVEMLRCSTSEADGSTGSNC